jgi:translation elongation factor EF-1beta
MDGKGLLKMRYASVAVTVAIVIMLILSGPATAVQIRLNINNTTPVQGEEITFTVTTDITGMDKYVPMQNFSLLLYNDDKIVRNVVFAPNGTILSGSQGVTIDPITVPLSSDYGYGYGYGYDHGYGYGYNFGYGYGYAANNGAGGSARIYIYNISLDTTNFDVGEYSARVVLNTGNDAKPKFSSTPIEFSIVPKKSEYNLSERLKDLQDHIRSLEEVDTGTKTSLAANLNNAIIMIEKEDNEKSIQRLEKVIGSIQEQHLPRNRLSSEQAEYIVSELESIIELMQKGEG